MDNYNILTYLKFRGDLTFKQSPFNELDALVLSTLVSLDFSEIFSQEEIISLEEAYILYAEKNNWNDDYTPNKREMLLSLAGKSSRFGKIGITDYVKDLNDEDKTFYAVTYVLSKFKIFVAYRGTDGSLASWKENFKTLFEFPTEGQRDAKDYLDNTIKKHPFAKCIIGGHSKGANLAVYASMYCYPKYQKKIINVYSFDGPGFINNIKASSEYNNIKGKIKSFIPEGSVIGRLMNPPYESSIVLSGGTGIYQHDFFNWTTSSNGFDKATATNLFSDSVSEKVNNWIYGIPLEDREKVVNELFDVFYKNNIMHVDALIHLDLVTILKIVKSMVSLSSENKAFLSMIIKELRK